MRGIGALGDANQPARDAEDRNWRALDPRRDEDDDAEEDEE